MLFPQPCYNRRMISHISGTVIAANDKYLVVQVSDLGYRVFATAESLVTKKTGDSVSLWTAHIVREDSEELFGFETIADLDLFELLTTISGIGPKSALGIMNVATGGTIARAINSNDTSYLTKISGIGKKTAEKIILELRDKLPAMYTDDVGASNHDALDALVALGYSESNAREAVRNLDPNLDMQSKIREGLKQLNK
jgi:holliday junction DNA helicase RuvA